MTILTGPSRRSLSLIGLLVLGCSEGTSAETAQTEGGAHAHPATDASHAMTKDSSAPPVEDAASAPDAEVPDASRVGDAGKIPDASMPDASVVSACSGRANGKLKVFVLAGQSNMVGQGERAPSADQLARNGGKGTLENVIKNAPTAAKFAHLVGPKGTWVERDDVWIVDLAKSGPLTVGYGASVKQIGPELEFGHVIGNFFEDPVLLIKTSWGGKSLYVDFRPPSSGGTVGPYYTMMVNRVREVLGDIKKFMPQYAGGGYEIAGFGWHQGWNDRISDPATNEYQANCVNLINDLRKDLCSKGDCPLGMPFALATTGMGGWDEKFPRAVKLMEAQLAVPADPKLVGGRTRAVETRGFWRTVDVSPADQGYHWNRNAETYLLIGEGLGTAIQKIVQTSCDR